MKDENDTCVKELSEEDKKISQCNICGQKFRFIKALRKHELRHQGTGGFICRTCGLAFTTSEAREKHRDKEHKVLRCRICIVRFDTETEYLHHVNSLHNGRDRELSMCSECGKQFKTKGELTHHVNSKCGTIKKYKCSICFQELMTAGSLHNHMLRHNGQRTFMCRYCAKTFLTAGQLTVHERIHTQEKAFICEVCNKGFCHRQSLITHSTLHTGIRPYQCEGCGNAFSCVGNLLKHRKTHRDTCGKIPLTTHRVKHPATRIKVQANTPAASKLKTHEKQKKLKEAIEILSNIPHDNNSNSYNSLFSNSGIIVNDSNHSSNADYIDKKIDNNVIEENKLNTIENQICNTDATKPNSCVIEDKWNDNSNSNDEKDDILRNYLLKPTITLDILDSSNNVIKNECEKDNNEKEVDLKNSFKNEMSDNEDWRNDHFDDNYLSGNDSDDSIDLFTRKIKLEQTQKEESPLKKNSPVKKTKNVRKSAVDRAKVKKFLEEREGDADGTNCKYCGCTYTNVGWLMRHEEKCAIERETKGYKCSCCNSVFPNKEECTNHQQCEHANILTCKECERVFANPDSVKAHINFYHKGVPRKVYIYVCEKCGKVFKQKALLLTHEQNNCGDGPLYQCNICEKAFTSKHVRKSHMRVHAPEKSLLCKFCGKSFHWKGQLKIHERSHTGERPFKCMHCPKAFSYRESLITHSTLHTGIKPHLCEACGSRFSCIGNLLKHRRTHASTCGMVTRVKAEEFLIS